MKTHFPPLDLDLRGDVAGWEKTEIRPEQELVVKKEGCELMVLRREIMGVSTEPLGDLSGSGDEIAASAAAFLC